MSGLARWTIWQRVFGLGLLSLGLLGCSLLPARGASAEERVALAQRAANVRFDQLAVGFQPAGSLGFTLRDTTIDEQLYRREGPSERAVLWRAQFTSRWPTTEDQLDRWSAQVIGLLADQMGPQVRLAGWERLDASDIGDERVAYRYLLATPAGELLGEATVVVFARGAEVGMTGTAAVGTQLGIDAAALARALLAGPTS
ncbi:MAG TPA: hypothetical protein VKZ60_16085 [Chloroflexota bacterium]|jgi:hypothetical protein|nr:hypothetical protein [Chloroflexota bacterium]